MALVCGAGMDTGARGGHRERRRELDRLGGRIQVSRVETRFPPVSVSHGFVILIHMTSKHSSSAQISAHRTSQKHSHQQHNMLPDAVALSPSQSRPSRHCASRTDSPRCMLTLSSPIRTSVVAEHAVRVLSVLVVVRSVLEGGRQWEEGGGRGTWSQQAETSAREGGTLWR